MVQSKFLFVAKAFFLAFFVINFPNLLPLDVNQPSYWFIISTTILDTTTLLVLSLSISKYVNLKNLKLFEKLYYKDSTNQNLIERISIFKTKTIQDRKLSFIFFIFFLILTLLQPIILILDINKKDVYSTMMVETINRDFDNKKKNIEDIISMQKKQITNENELNKLENSISDLSNIRDKNIEQFLKTNTKNKFNSSKTIIRNILLGILWAFVFYKIYII